MTHLILQQFLGNKNPNNPTIHEEATYARMCSRDITPMFNRENPLQIHGHPDCKNLKGKYYCKYHNSYNHTINSC